MKTPISSKIFIIILMTALCLFAEWRNGEMEIRVDFRSISELENLLKMSLSGEIYNSAGYGYFYVDKFEFDRVKSAGYKVTIIEADLNKRSNTFWSNERSRATYMSYDEIITLMDNLVSSYPEICKKTVYGTSVEGRELFALKISDSVNVDENEAEILFDGGIHGDELGGPENMSRFAKFLCESYSSNSTISDLIDSREIWIYPMVNPDGRVDVSRENANNKDLNRNWGYMWNAECLTNIGFSQPETKAIRNCMLENQFSIQVSNHSGIEAIFLAWCNTDGRSPDYKLHKYLADVYKGNSGYYNLNVKQSNLDYATTGETIDYAYGVMGTAPLTMELSSGKQPSNPTDIYNKNQDAMVEMIKYSGYGIAGKITDKVSNEPIAATIYIDNSYPIYSDPKVGDYHRFMKSGTYSMRVEANGYQTKLINEVTVASDTASSTYNITLDPIADSVIYGYKVVYLKLCGGISYKVLGEKNNEYLALGYNGDIVIDMQYNIFDRTGNDLTVYASSNSNYNCFVSSSIEDDWTSLGSGNGETVFDFDGVISDSIRYVRITGNSINLDAISANHDKITKISLTKIQTDINPVLLFRNGKFLIKNLGNKNYEFAIFNAQGKNCFTQTLTNKSSTINWTNQAKGVYFAKLSGAFGKVVIKTVF